MKTVLLYLGGFVGLVVACFAWRIFATIAGGRRAYRELALRLGPVLEALERGEEPRREDLVRFARDRATRRVLHDALSQHEKLALFPREYLRWELVAEGDLVGWLCHPHELGCAPDEIELMGQVPAPAGAHAGRTYFVFRYRTKPPHWAADQGWLAGVAGPYALAEEPAPWAPGTFSRFEAWDSRTPEQHVAATHAAVLEPRG
jgi:hypothetical protein